ncbi:2223_t:CDS:2, partial [Funneliformis geosporum]
MNRQKQNIRRLTAAFRDHSKKFFRTSGARHVENIENEDRYLPVRHIQELERIGYTREQGEILIKSIVESTKNLATKVELNDLTNKVIEINGKIQNCNGEIQKCNGEIQKSKGEVIKEFYKYKEEVTQKNHNVYKEILKEIAKSSLEAIKTREEIHKEIAKSREEAMKSREEIHKETIKTREEVNKQVEVQKYQILIRAYVGTTGSLVSLAGLCL